MTYEELDAKLQDWVDALETQQAIVKEHQDKVEWCQYMIKNISDRMTDLAKQA